MNTHCLVTFASRKPAKNLGAGYHFTTGRTGRTASIIHRSNGQRGRCHGCEGQKARPIHPEAAALAVLGEAEGPRRRDPRGPDGAPQHLVPSLQQLDRPRFTARELLQAAGPSMCAIPSMSQTGNIARVCHFLRGDQPGNPRRLCIMARHDGLSLLSTLLPCTVLCRHTQNCDQRIYGEPSWCPQMTASARGSCMDGRRCSRRSPPACGTVPTSCGSTWAAVQGCAVRCSARRLV